MIATRPQPDSTRDLTVVVHVLNILQKQLATICMIHWSVERGVFILMIVLRVQPDSTSKLNAVNHVPNILQKQLAPNCMNQFYVENMGMSVIIIMIASRPQLDTMWKLNVGIVKKEVVMTTIAKNPD